jgi:excisionase family DNA binding protein
MKTNRNDSDELLGIEAVAALLGCSHMTIRRMVAAGKLPAPIQIGQRLIRWRRSDVLAAIG